MRQLVLSPRWMLWHLLTLGAMATCGWLAVWQWQRAGSALGSAINIGYGLQWPIFAVFFGVMWWRFLRMESRELAVALAQPADADPPTTAGPPTADDPPTTAGRVTADGRVTAGPAESANLAADTVAPSPFTRGPDRRTPVTDEEDPDLAAYNRMLAILADRDRAQS